MKTLALLLRASCLALALCAAPASASRHVVIVSVDGLRPDVALRAKMPAFRSLMDRGSFSMYAMTTDVAITLPSHTSMLTGVTPLKHGIHYNSDPRPVDPPAPAWPTIFELAHRAGLSTAMCAGKSKFSVLAQPGTLDSVLVPPPGSAYSDSLVASRAVRWIRRMRPDLLFVHLPSLDTIGHSRKWGSREQVAAAELCDRELGRVLNAIRAAGLEDSTLVILSTDHGGAGTTHGGLDARSRLIPWVAAGPGVKRDFDLAQIQDLQVHTEDTFATAAAWLGLALAKPVDGRAVTEIHEAVPR